MNNTVLENVRKHRYIKLVIAEARRNSLVSEPNSLTTKTFSGKFFSHRSKKTHQFMKKLVYLGLLIL